MIKNLYISALLDVYGEFLGDKAKALTECYYNEDLSLSEIAENAGITRQGVRDRIKRSEDVLLNLEKKCGYCEKFSKLKELSSMYSSGDKSVIDEMLEVINGL